MADRVKGIPDNSSVVMPRLFCRDVAAEIDFCKNTFDAVELGRRPGPDGTVVHGLMTIGSAMIMIEAEWPSLASRAPKPDGSSPVVIFVYVEDVDKTVEHAVQGGAKVLVPVENQFWGDRIGWVMDPSGHVWTIATRIEETTEAERKDRWGVGLYAKVGQGHPEVMTTTATKASLRMVQDASVQTFVDLNPLSLQTRAS